MSQLHRIILLHTHLAGVVEIDVDAHTNFCGTNASGKTTLQRLIPVFYGEQPNRVVPKTRKKFDEFYLPYRNSYIIYEYQRDDQSLCQVVLTRKSEGGVEYRFVGAPYQSEHYLIQSEQGLTARAYAQWAAAMRQYPDVQISPKISATSEYRSIIQNDVAGLRGNHSDSLRLRRLAAEYGLVSGPHRLRHIEKLVSAVHAKEGKMDTLKSMLAAIFEEDGVTLPTTKVKNTKAREWIQQMRQSMRLEPLQQNFEMLQQLAVQLAGHELQLAQLLPVLEKDYEQQKRLFADAQAQLAQVRDELKKTREQYVTARDVAQAEQSRVDADLQEKTIRLDNLQQRFDDYENQNMPQLQRDSASLPLWRETLEELKEQHHLMLEQHQDIERQLAQRKAKLGDALQRLSEQHRVKTRDLQQQKDALRERQQQKRSDHEHDYQSQRQHLQNQFHQQITDTLSEIAVLESQLNHSSLTPAQLEPLQQAELRLEQLQQNYQSVSRQQARLQQQWQQSRELREKADQALSQMRLSVRQQQQALAQLQTQLTPQEGTLRQLLRQHQPGWEQRFGKVIEASLLERTDLSPQFDDAGETILGVRLDLNVIDAPEYAQDETELTAQLHRAELQLGSLQQKQQHAEKELNQCHENSQLLREQVEQAQWQVTQAEQDIDYAREARDRLRDELQQLNVKNQCKWREQFENARAQQQQIEQRQDKALTALNDDYQAQKLEFQLDWESELQTVDDAIEMLERQLEQKRDSHRAQLQELEQAFNEELSDKGVDPSRIAQSKQRQQQLQTQIESVAARLDELVQWQRFMELDWQQYRPKLLEEETQLKQMQRQCVSQLEHLHSDFTQQRQRLDERKEQCQNELHYAESWVQQLTPLLTKLRVLDLAPAQQSLAAGSDLTERMSRASETLASRSQLEKQLRDQLEQFELLLSKDAGVEFLDRLDYEKRKLPENSPLRASLHILGNLLHILRDQQRQLLEMGENIGGDLKKFFIVFRDINQRIARQSKRLSDAVADDLTLEGIERSEVKIISTIDELGFWEPLKHFANLYDEWSQSGKALPSDAYLDALADVVELLRANEQYQMESLLRLELHLRESGSELVIKNDRQLLESSSHGMAYLILCKYLLAFTRLMRGDAVVTIHWPIDEIGTLAYHNVEKLFQACSDNQIIIVGAFPNPESDVLMLFSHRYLLAVNQQDPTQRQLKRIQPKLSPLAQTLAQTMEIPS
ncbi:ATP-binding protein [Celerinatantimonas sp. YJH-8]|uniref:ATP-binding protein n=1 Tax=Celerinatantimonas sp. YJH-8 TaxID=3228714 RepID=UPI0038CAD9CB